MRIQFNLHSGLLLASVLVILTGCGMPSLTVDEMVERAAALCDRGRGEEALQLLDQVTAKETDFPQAYYLKGIAYELSHELHQAKQAYDKCIEQAPSESDAYNNRGAVLLKLGHFTEAQSDLQKATELNPNDDLAWANLGLVQQELGQLEAAIASVKRAVAISRNAIHYLQLGNLLSEISNHQEAEHAFSESLKIDPHNASTYLSRSRSLARLGRTQEALSDLESARAADNSLTLQGPIRQAKQELIQR